MEKRVVLDMLRLKKGIEPYLKHLAVFGVGFDMLIYYIIEAAVSKNQIHVYRAVELEIRQHAKPNHRNSLEQIAHAAHDALEDAIPIAREILHNYLGEYRDSVTVERFLGRDIILKLYIPENDADDSSDTAPSETGEITDDNDSIPNAGGPPGGIHTTR